MLKKWKLSDNLTSLRTWLPESSTRLSNAAERQPSQANSEDASARTRVLTDGFLAGARGLPRPPRTLNIIQKINSPVPSADNAFVLRRTRHHPNLNFLTLKSGLN